MKHRNVNWHFFRLYPSIRYQTGFLKNIFSTVGNFWHTTEMHEMFLQSIMPYQFRNNNGIWHHKIKLIKLPFSLSAPKFQVDKILYNKLMNLRNHTEERLHLSLKIRIEYFGIWTIQLILRNFLLLFMR